ncbi:FAD-dependent monooxygenase [Gordonia liuliyuniae]|uniref:FAD-dependent monooxygenase n=1 Tax=Gordonia liuliyuniae TaxID=2911517 RepID=A0ABS9IPW0_9ACTN|nr:FAD-dependent monooxygenase [Gordonia liuliyuniae]MCF8587597.1 FAD-dependent monooxygenase [Gordonia liuliyuniae]
MKNLDVAVVGAGVGGLTAAIAMRRLGNRVSVYEQSSGFSRVGADINLTPNAVRALDGLGGGVAEWIRANGGRPQFRLSRMWDTGEETSRIELGADAEQRYGSPQLTLHRADLMTALESELPDGVVELGKRLENIVDGPGGVRLRFSDGSEATAAVVIGADGIHSRVREALLGADSPEFTGIVAFRAVVPADRVGDLVNADCFIKWWGPDLSTQIVTFPLGLDEVFVFATVGQPEWTEESWSTPGSIAELQGLYADFHPDARALLDRCGDVLKSALYVRRPLPSWSGERAVLLGDACHPMTPFMAQGAGQACEDAVVLARCLSESDDPSSAFARYEAVRKPRTSEIQAKSRGNDWLRSAGNGDWVYAYDAWSVPVDA